jgi:hypothetical protein
MPRVLEELPQVDAIREALELLHEPVGTSPQIIVLILSGYEVDDEHLASISLCRNTYP